MIKGPKENKFSKIPIGLIGFAIGQILGALWWAAKVDRQVAICEKHTEEIPKIQERIEAMLEEINQLEERCYGK